MVTIIGDVHGKYEAYHQIIRDCEYSVQLGDMGFSYDYLNYKIDSEKHKFFGGNHDNYDQYPIIKHSLGDFGGRTHNDLDFYFVRGAYSIDIMYRLNDHMNSRANFGSMKAWWHQEELTYQKMKECEADYLEVMPKIMITHTAPTKAVRDNFTNDLLIRLGFDPDFTSKTADFLQTLFEQHQPDLWIFGHFHKDVRDTINGTEFVCLPELGFIDV